MSGPTVCSYVKVFHISHVGTVLTGVLAVCVAMKDATVSYRGSYHGSC
jgi:hypothetical protein